MPPYLYETQIIVMFLAIILGPVTAVLITLWVQSHREKVTAKRQLFLTLMGERKSLLISSSLAQSLNTIDVVFHDNAEVVRLWHNYYALLSQPPSQQREHTWLELLTAMAQDLRLSKIHQTDLDSFYVPQAHADQIQIQLQVQAEWLRVLKNTERFVTVQKGDAHGAGRSGGS